MRPAALLCVAVVLLAGSAPAAAVTVQQDGVSPEGTTIVVDIQADGDARVAVLTAFNRETSNESAAFDRLAERFKRGEAGGYSPEQFEAVAMDVSERTGREMEITDITRTALTTNETGYLALNFTWTNFAVVEDDGDRIVVQDAFNTSEGRWLTRLGEDQTLILRPPPGYSPSTAPVAPQDGVLRWGPGATVTLGQEPVVFTGSTPTTPREEPLIGSPLTLLGGGLAVVVVVGIGYLLLQRDGPAPGGAAAADTDGGSPGGPPPDGAVPSADGESEPEPASEPTDDGIDPELLSDEEQVQRLLERNGGRMKQANIVDETGWSNAKVSQLLSSMAEDGQVEKLRIGRENLISLPDEED